MAKLTGVAVFFFLVTVGMSGCSAQTQTDLGSFTQEMVPRESKTCNDIRNNLEMMLFSTYKGSIPRTLLKQILPGLADPLLPVECVQGGGHRKWLLESTTDAAPAADAPDAAPAASDQSSKRVQRQTGGFFMPPLTNVKDPGDHPPPGSMFRDPMKDPGDGPLTPALRMIPQPLPAPWTVPTRPEARDMYAKPFRGRFYGDLLPPSRHKRSAAEEEEEEEEDVALVRHKRANGEEEKKGPNLDSLVFSTFPFADVPDHRAAAAASAPMDPFTQMLLSSIRQFFSPRRRQRTSPLQQRARASAARRSQYGPRPNVMYGDAPGYRGTAVRSQAPVVQPPVLLAPAAFIPPAVPAPPPAPARPSVLRSPANQAPAPRSNLVQPPVTSYLPAGVPPSSSSGFASLLAPAASPQPLPGAPLQPASAAAAAPGVIYGDALPSYGSTSIAASPGSRRVKRASDNSSPSDVVTFGDFSMPADTFKKLISPRDRYPEDSDRHGGSEPRSYARPPPPPPSPRYYPGYNHVARRPPVFYGSLPVPRQAAPVYQRGYPFSSPFARARQAHLLNAQQRRLGLTANQIALARAQAARAAPRAAQAAPLGLGAPGVGMLSYAQPLALPMGAAQPVYGNHPAY